MTKQRAVILGASGQDGQFLADYLIENAYDVLGVVRKLPANDNRLNLNRPKFVVLDLSDFPLLEKTLLEFSPNYIYNLAGESSVSKSFNSSANTLDINSFFFFRLLELIASNNNLREVKLFQASSSEMFGDYTSHISEQSPTQPVSPYGISKYMAHKLAAHFRSTRDIFVSCGILFNHESELRPGVFVTKKIVKSMIALKRGEIDSFELESLDVIRDWGYAPDYVKAMHLIATHHEPDDFVVATGISHTVRNIVEVVGSFLGLTEDTDRFVKVKHTLRPINISQTTGDPSKIARILGWKSLTTFEDMLIKMTQYELEASN